MSRPGKVLVIFGTRPEATKLAPVIRALNEHHGLQTRVCISAQHRGMLDQALALFQLRVDYDLDIMQLSQTLSGLTGRLLLKLADVLDDARPDIIVVQGDTTTTLCGALAGFYARVPVAHVEAGLRTYDKQAPFPEEVNRQLVTRIADLHFPPTDYARDALLQEGIEPERAIVTGNTAVDAVLLAAELLEQQPQLGRAPALDMLLDERPIILVTAHRRESFGEPLARMFSAIAEVARRHPERQVVYPVHLNPAVQGPAMELLGGIPNLKLTQPLEYAPFVELMRRSDLVLTDSGGIQEEAPALGVPVVVMRDRTERPEGLTAGTLVLAGTRTDEIISAVERVLAGDRLSAAELRSRNPYGDGHAADRIQASIAAFLRESDRRN